MLCSQMNYMFLYLLSIIFHFKSHSNLSVSGFNLLYTQYLKCNSEKQIRQYSRKLVKSLKLKYIFVSEGGYPPQGRVLITLSTRGRNYRRSQLGANGT